MFVSFVSQNGMTALMCASARGHTDIVELLLLSAAQVDIQSEVVRHNINLTAMSLSISDTTFDF